MSGFPPKADIQTAIAKRLLLTQTGHWRRPRLQLVSMHIPQDELDRPEWQRPKSVDFSFAPFEDARLLLSLATKRGPQAVATTTVAPDDVPVMGGIAYSLHSYRPLRKLSPPLIEFEANGALQLNNKFLGLSENQKAHLRIPLRKLNEFFAEWDLVQAAIDLRTCLEALFLDGNKEGEFRYRLGLRAALFVGKNLEQRKAVGKAIRKAYDAGSEAVHTGKIKKMDQARNYIRAPCD